MQGHDRNGHEELFEPRFQNLGNHLMLVAVEEMSSLASTNHLAMKIIE